MRRGILGSIAAVAAGAGAAWGQTPAPVAPAGDPPPPAAIAPAGDVVPAQATGSPFGAGPAPVIMPPLGPGPAGDPQGLGPVAGFGPPPGPMYPNPGPYAAPMFQPGPSQGGGAPGGGGAYGRAPHWWVSADYLLMFSRSQPIRFPLLTTSAPIDNGLLGRSSTVVLAGNNDITYSPFSGARITGGFYGDADRRYGFETTVFATEDKQNLSTFVASPTGIPTLARPYIDSSNVRTNTALVIGNLSFGSAVATVDSKSQAFSAEANGLVNIYRTEPGCAVAWSLDFIGGYRYFMLDEYITLDSTTTLNIAPTITPTFAIGPGGLITQTGTTSTPGTARAAGLVISTPGTVQVTDTFRVMNQFNGGQVGMRGEARYGMFTVAATGKFAVGNMHQRLEVIGITKVADPITGRSGSAYGGLYANASNIGTYNHDEFTVIPEGNINVGLNVSRSLTAFIGYNFLYVNNVARPGSEINPVVSGSTIPFTATYGAQGRTSVPRAIFNQEEYWLMSVNFGFMVRF